MKAITSIQHILRPLSHERGDVAPRYAPRACARRLLSALASMLLTPERAREDFLAASADHEDYERRLRLWVERDRQGYHSRLQPPAF